MTNSPHDSPAPPEEFTNLDAASAWSRSTELFLSQFKPSTQELYRRRLGYWREFLESLTPLPRPWEVALFRYGEYRARLSSLDLAPATIAARLIPVRSFARWLGTLLPGAGVPPVEQIRLLTRTRDSRSRSRSPALTAQQDILTNARSHSLRSSLLVRLILLAGLRPSEVVAAELRHLVPEPNGGCGLEIPHSRTIPIVYDTLLELDSYLEQRGLHRAHNAPAKGHHLVYKPDAPLLANSRDEKPVTPRAIRKTLATLRATLGEQGLPVSARTLRNAFIINLLAMDVPTDTVLAVSGASSVASLQPYHSYLESSSGRRQLEALAKLLQQRSTPGSTPSKPETV